MTERRSLAEGLKTAVRPPADPKLEKAFVYGDKADQVAAPPEAPLPASIRTPANTRHRVPLSTKIRADLAEALKQASLKRQLSGEQPSKVQEILEAALEPWLRSNGYLN